MSSKVPSQAELEANKATLEKRNANLEKLKAKALSNGSTNTANEYQRMINENSVKIGEYSTNINNYTNYFKSETQQLNYERAVSGGPKGTEDNPIPSSVNAITKTTVTEVSTDSGGGTYTVSRAKDTPTAASQSLQTQADALKTQSELYLVDPNTAAGQKLLQQSVSNGTITQTQLNEIKSLSPDQRFDRASELANQSISTESQAQAAMTRGQTSVDYNPSTTTTTVSTVFTDTGNLSPTISGAIPESGITVVQNGDTSFQVVNNYDGTSSYTLPSGSSINLDTSPTSQNNSSSIASEWRGQASQAQQQKNEAENKLVSNQAQRTENQAEINRINQQLSNPNTSDDQRNELQQQLSSLSNENRTLTLQENSLNSEINTYQNAINVSNTNAENAEIAAAGVDNPTTQVATNDPALPSSIVLSPEEAAFLDADGYYNITPSEINEADDIGSGLADATARAAADEAAYVIDTPPDISGADDISAALADAEARQASEELGFNVGADEGFVGGGPGATSAVTVQPNTDQFVGDSKNSNQSPEVQFQKAVDWRVRISLAPSAPYFYNAASQTDILYPLKATNGVVFPYVPTVNLTYSANYEASDPTHSNYKIYSYRGSSVSDISINADFTAQNAAEAIYLRAVIHFFRSATKMFYGKDQSPKAGIPPPLLYLSGFGEYQFDNHPMVLASFQYSLPNDVDYIMAGDIRQSLVTGSAQLNAPASSNNPFTAQFNRLLANRLQKGGLNEPPVFKNVITGETTRIPTKMSMVLTFHPIVTRRMVSDKFSLKDYATGKLLNGSKNAGYGGGVW